MSSPTNTPPPARTRDHGQSLLLSYRQAAKLLGISRGSSLHDLIQRGLLRPVTLCGQQRIPREQVEELARNGEEAALPTPPRAPRPPRGEKRKLTIADVAI